MSKKTTRYYIPHPDDPECKIAGDLEQVEPDKPMKGRKIALIAHGVMGHKDYLFQKRLAKRLPIDSFRFDFRGNHETGGPWNMSGFDNDIADIDAVVKFLHEELGYKLDMIIGHSRGSIMCLKWICTRPEGRAISYYVNCSGRYRMERMRKRNTEVYQPVIDKQGYYEWKVKVAGKEVVGKIYAGDGERFASWDNSFVWTEFPQHIHVLTMHGLADDTVPPYDAVIYARVYSARKPGTHTLHFVEDANHNFIGKYDEVNDTVLEWFQQAREGNITTGVWKTGVKPKL